MSVFIYDKDTLANFIAEKKIVDKYSIEKNIYKVFLNNHWHQVLLKKIF